MFDLWFLQLVQSNFVLFCTYAADLRDHFQNIVLTILVSTAVITHSPHKHPKINIYTYKLHHLARYCCFLFTSDLLTRLNHFQNNILHICVTHHPLAHVYPGFCCDKHPIVAMVSAEVWEEDGSFLRYHGECTVCILVRESSFKHWRLHFDVCAILWIKLGMWYPCLGHRNTLWRLTMTFSLYLVDHALHHDAGLHPQCCGGLRRGCLLWTQCGCLAPAAMVRLQSTTYFAQEDHHLFTYIPRFLGKPLPALIPRGKRHFFRHIQDQHLFEFKTPNHL